MTMASPSIPTTDVREAERRIREDPARPLLIDVREPVEFTTVRAPGAVLMPMSTFTARQSELPTDRPLLFICHSGGRSAAVTSFLVRAGRSDVTNVVGGMEAWSAAGLPTRLGPVTPGEGDLPAE